MQNVRIVEEQFTLPYTPHIYQIDTVKRAAEFQCVLLMDPVGLGKSLMSLYLGLYHSIVNGVEQILVLTPPALIDQTAEFIQSVKGIEGTLIFRGSPTERKAMSLMNSPVVIMSYNIFRLDFDRIALWARKRKLFILADEISLKSMRRTYKCVKLLMFRKLRVANMDKPFHYLCALNATPISDREQIYGWCSIFNHPAYATKAIFLLTHGGAVDNWGNVISWNATDIMDENFEKFSVVSKNVQLELPESVFTELPYSLEKKHARLYNDIAEAEFDLLPPDMIESAVESMFSTLQRVILTPKDFGLDIRSPILDIIDQYFDQLNEDDKLILYSRHVAVSQMLQEAYPQAVSYFGKVKATDKKTNLQQFKTGDAQIMIANLDSLGKGQNLQVANHTIYVEVPFRSDVLTQACGRTARQGQKKTCFFLFPVAKGTIQRQIYRRLLDNDAELLKFNRNKQALKDFIKAV